MQSTHQGILRTLIYFDLFDYPLTTEQLWRWYFPVDGQPVERAQFDQALSQLQAEGKILQTQNFWHRPGRELLVELRLERQVDNQRKWRLARFGSSILSLVPFVRMVAVCNTVAINNAKPTSDIDLLVVVQPGRLWLARLWSVLVLSAWRMRRHGTRVANKLCLSFFITEDALNFQPLLLQPRDEYFYFWIEQLVPVYESGDVYNRLRHENAWVKEFLPNALAERPTPPAHVSWYQRMKEPPLRGQWGNRLEQFAKRSQLAKMKHVPNVAATGAAILTDDILKFHERDRRQEYNERFRAAVAERK